jgi:hypothetical protein
MPRTPTTQLFAGLVNAKTADDRLLAPWKISRNADDEAATGLATILLAAKAANDKAVAPLAHAKTANRWSCKKAALYSYTRTNTEVTSDTNARIDAVATTAGGDRPQVCVQHFGSSS